MLALIVLATVVSPPPVGVGSTSPPIHVVDPDGLNWQPAADLPGAEVAVVDGQLDRAHVAYVRVPGGWGLRSHWHGNALRLIVLRGAVRLQEPGRAALTLPSEGFAEIPAYLPHTLRCADANGCTIAMQQSWAFDIVYTE